MSIKISLLQIGFCWYLNNAQPQKLVLGACALIEAFTVCVMQFYLRSMILVDGSVVAVPDTYRDDKSDGYSILG